jgi:hypothetical protein
MEGLSQGDNFTCYFLSVCFGYIYHASQIIKSPVLRVRISNLKVQTVEHDLQYHDFHIEISSEIKIYIFFKKFCYFFRLVQSLLV